MSPVSSPPAGRSAPRGFPYGVLAPIGLALALYFSVLGILSMFRVGSDLAALGRAVAGEREESLRKVVAFNVGGLTTGLARAGLSFVKLPPEARAGLKAVRAAEVGVYSLENEPNTRDRTEMFARADKAMARRGWTKIVGVVEDNNLVGVYVPKNVSTLTRMRCGVMVLTRGELVLVSAKANLEPLLGLINQQLQSERNAGTPPLFADEIRRHRGQGGF